MTKRYFLFEVVEEPGRLERKVEVWELHGDQVGSLSRVGTGIGNDDSQPGLAVIAAAFDLAMRLQREWISRRG